MKNSTLRAISSYDAAACAEGVNDVCHCRCGGALHGKSHAAYIKQEREAIEAGIFTKEAIGRIVARVLAANGRKGRKSTKKS